MRKTENLVQLDPGVEENLIHKSSEVELVTPGWDIIDQAEVDAAGPKENKIVGKIYIINGKEFDSTLKENKRAELN